MSKYALSHVMKTAYLVTPQVYGIAENLSHREIYMYLVRLLSDKLTISRTT